MIRETRLRVASNHTHGWQANEKTHLCVASGIRAMPEKEKPPAMRVDDYLIGGDEQSPGLRGNLLNDYNPNMSSLAPSGDLFPEK